MASSSEKHLFTVLLRPGSTLRHVPGPARRRAWSRTQPTRTNRVKAAVRLCAPGSGNGRPRLVSR